MAKEQRKRIKAFMLTPTGNEWRFIRAWSVKGVCVVGSRGYHYAEIALGTFPLDAPKQALEDMQDQVPRGCHYCEYQFAPDDELHITDDRIYVTDEGHQFSLRSPPVGALWFVDYLGPNFAGPDGRTLMAMTPGGVWCIDSQASNCTMKEDVGPYGTAHRCWIRHGVPPNVTVDKKGHTCKAGKGSIKMPNYHGYLRDGFFT